MENALQTMINVVADSGARDYANNGMSDDKKCTVHIIIEFDTPYWALTRLVVVNDLTLTYVSYLSCT